MNHTMFSLPLPPSLNSAYRSVVVGGHGRVLLSAAGRKYKDDIKKLVSNLKSFNDARLEVSYTYFFKDRRKSDIANREKLLSDSLEGCLFDNDSQIDYMQLKRGGVDKENPRVEIVIQSI